uniref:Uncharacterized protein n=1 Tax=Pithovirus LCPAC001 TaxID=2506585 RepID=A0A481Z2D3_9VIRU|nr:MAG: hypothetical protein LCPAC001_01140 [Pithovirus LCPAC001]
MLKKRKVTVTAVGIGAVLYNKRYIIAQKSLENENISKNLHVQKLFNWLVRCNSERSFLYESTKKTIERSSLVKTMIQKEFPIDNHNWVLDDEYFEPYSNDTLSYNLVHPIVYFDKKEYAWWRKNKRKNDEFFSESKSRILKYLFSWFRTIYEFMFAGEKYLKTKLIIKNTCDDFDVNYENVTTIHNNFLGLAGVINMFGQIILVLNDDFHNISTNSKKFVLAHEFHHVKQNDTLLVINLTENEYGIDEINELMKIREMKCDIKASLHFDINYVKGSISFLNRVLLEKGFQGGDDHPSTSDRFAQSLNIYIQKKGIYIMPQFQPLFCNTVNLLWGSFCTTIATIKHLNKNYNFIVGEHDSLTFDYEHVSNDDDDLFSLD